MRINLFGGPSCGKSTTATWLFSELKRDGLNIELVTEYVKQWTYIKRHPESYDQLLIFSKQLSREDLVLRAGYENLITDSPLLVGCYYSKLYSVPVMEELISISKKFESEHSSINIFLDRRNRAYNNIGRFQTKEQALEVDKSMIKFLDEHLGTENFIVIPTDDKDGIYQYVKEQLK